MFKTFKTAATWAAGALLGYYATDGLFRASRVTVRKITASR